MQADAALFQIADQAAVRRDHGVPVVVRDFAEEVHLAGQEHQPLGGDVVDDEVFDLLEGLRLDFAPAAPGRVAAEAHAVVAPPFLQIVGAGPHRDAAEADAVLLDGLVRDDGGVGERGQPGKDMEGLLERDADGPVVGRLDLLDGAHRPETARGVRLVAEAVEGVDDVGRDDGAPLPVREAGVVAEAGPFAQTIGIDLRVRGHHGHLAQARLQAVGPREVVHFEQRFVDERDRARLADAGRAERIQRRHALERTAEDGRTVEFGAGQGGQRHAREEDGETVPHTTSGISSPSRRRRRPAPPSRLRRRRRRRGRRGRNGCCGRCSGQPAA